MHMLIFGVFIAIDIALKSNTSSTKIFYELILLKKERKSVNIFQEKMNGLTHQEALCKEKKIFTISLCSFINENCFWSFYGTHSLYEIYICQRKI